MSRFETELAWLGGFFDAEGTISYMEMLNKKYTRWSIFNTDKTMIIKAQRIVEEVIGHVPKICNIKAQKENYKDGFQISVNSVYDVLLLCHKMLPYLYGKKKQCSSAIEFMENKLYPLIAGLKGEIKPLDEDVAWLAGFIEGDGMIRIRERSKYTAWHLALTNTSMEIINNGKRIIESIIKREVKVYKKTPTKNTKVWYVYEIGRGEDILVILKLILPYLSGKKTKAEEAIASISEKFSYLIKLYGGHN